MRVIVSNQCPIPRPATAAAELEPHFVVGEIGNVDGSNFVYVRGLPGAGDRQVAFALNDGHGRFAGGPDLTYLDYWLYNHDEVAAWLKSNQLTDATPASATKGYALSGVTTGQTANGYKARI